ncbi:hypothetical protein DMENIID0001_056000 [Sergentomyia squamirostris]
MSESEVKCGEDSVSSDDTEFMDLPLPPIPSKATEVHNVDVHPSVAAFLMARMDCFDDLRHVDSDGEIISDSEEDSVDPPKSIRDQVSREKSTIWSTSDEETAPYADKSPLLAGSETSSLEILEHFRETHQSSCDDSTCCDEDFTWVRSERLSEEPQSLPTTLPPTAASVPSGKPPRPAGSLDRRRHLSTNRQERDSKSRSAHSLIKEKSSHGPEKHHQDKHLTRTGSFEGADNNYSQHRRGSPGFWEPPPPSYPYHWETPPHPYWSACHASREELRLMEMHRRHQDHMYRYGSSGALNASHQDLYNGCCSRYHPAPPPMPPCCSCDRLNHWTPNQRQDIDERLRRLQSDKESLALQVQVLSEQVAAQNEKISDLERMLTEKTQLLSNADDLLHREMLSRSSLETQKLELMSAMSELKLQQAALERENLELRTSQLNNNSIMTRRPPMVPSRALASFPATPPPHGSVAGSLTSTPLGGSHGNLQQHSSASSTPATPKVSLLKVFLELFLTQYQHETSPFY